MTENELKNLVENWETPKIEFKETILKDYSNIPDQSIRSKKIERDIAELVKDISAIANSDGETEHGYLIVGIREKNKKPIKGGPRINETKRTKVLKYISQRVHPPIKIEFQTLNFLNQPIEIIKIFTDRNQRPYQITTGPDEGRIFLRKGSVTEIAKIVELIGTGIQRARGDLKKLNPPGKLIFKEDLDRDVLEVIIKAPFIKSDDLIKNLNFNEMRVYKLLNIKDKITLNDCQENLKISKSTALRALKKLIEKGYINKETILGMDYFSKK